MGVLILIPNMCFLSKIKVKTKSKVKYPNSHNMTLKGTGPLSPTKKIIYSSKNVA